MNRTLAQLLVLFVFAAGLSVSLAETPVLGVITARGAFHIDQSPVTGNATLFEGNRITAGKASSQIHLNGGARMQLDAGSSGVVFKDRLVLEKGSGQISSPGNYQIEARSLRVRGTAETTARVLFVEPDNVEVAAVRGPIRVYKTDGVLLAKLDAGRSLTFSTAVSGASAPSVVTGCLDLSAGQQYLIDETSTVRFLLNGSDLAAYAGKRVEITGSLQPGTSESGVVKVLRVKVLASSCNPPATAKTSQNTSTTTKATAKASAKATAKAAGLSVGSKAVIAGVVVAGAATGVAVAAVNEEEETISPTTR